ncbi:hypothetical protein Bpse01_17470 [Bifidobacterium pseudocatenulatum]|nr:hypothetical protein DN0207_11540 [Bifidobacterium pseudocatenulatum]GLZ83878.1 hypothetical protein Bpse01_17470 [Bifidobacterium pseudocatenulatum]
MNALMHNGHRNENPRVPISTPYDMARKKKLMQIGSTLGNAALNARVFTPPHSAGSSAFLPAIRGKPVRDHNAL